MRSTITQAAKLALILGVTLILDGCASAAEEVPDDAAQSKQGLMAMDPINPPANLPVLADTPIPPAPPKPSLAAIMSEFSNYDMNDDGLVEINSLKALFDNPEPYVARPNGLLIVFVDPRLVTNDPNIKFGGALMQLWLALYGADLANEGYFPYFVEAHVYSGKMHQDGRTLLAMRRFLQRVKEHYPLTGTQLIGSFPEAAILRSKLVKPHADGEITFESGTNKTVSDVDYLSLNAGMLTPRGEIVLADLDGNWENVYREHPFTFTSYKVLPKESSSAYPSDGQVITTPFYTELEQSFEDVFFVQDAQVYTKKLANNEVELTIRGLNEPSHEVSAQDRARPNRIASPEIMVSRINARHVAIQPSAPMDLDGKLPLATDGKPQALRYAGLTSLTWKRDATLERKLIADYIARAHAFRLTHHTAQSFRTSAVRQLDSGLKSPSSFNNYLSQAAEGFGTSFATDQADLLDYVNWLKQPAVLRGIASHSGPTSSAFGAAPSTSALETAVGGRPFRWVGRSDGRQYLLEPSLEGAGGGAKFYLYRTLWENQALASAGQMFIVHGGCDVMNPTNFEYVPYNHPDYGQHDENGAVQNAESILFYGNALAIMGRGKDYYDTPRGFIERVKSTGRFGLGWRAYFDFDAADPVLDEREVAYGESRRERTTRRKRSYFWNVIGDFTLKLNYD